jgi:hypothetical protein
VNDSESNSRTSRKGGVNQSAASVPEVQHVPSVGVYDRDSNGDRDSLKCNTPLFSGHAIVDSPLKGWSWYANAPPGSGQGSS